MEGEIGVLQVEKRIRSRVKRQMEKTQREYYLNEQMKAIQRELGDGEEGSNEAAELEDRIKKTKLSKEARNKAEGELKKLKQMSPMSAEATVVRNYLDWLLSLPWARRARSSTTSTSPSRCSTRTTTASRRSRTASSNTWPCSAAPASSRARSSASSALRRVGKTSLGKSIAKATGREFIRMSLGGVRDEAEIRGHRRTYIGSMPGKVIQSMRKAGKTNPLFLLDEIDKMGMDFRGDPSSALLEVLDPEQNSTFNDHYLEVDYDLSDVMFVTTSNTLNIPPPLMDRMEIIRLTGYTEEEKFEIAQPAPDPGDAQARTGCRPKEFVVGDDELMTIVRNYTREAGVRNLKREIRSSMRKAVPRHPHGKKKTVKIDAAAARGYLGPPLYRYDQIDARAAGGRRDRSRLDAGRWRNPHHRRRDDARQGPHDGHRQPQGSDEGVDLGGDHGYVRSRAVDFGIKPPLFDTRDIHVHVPEGATPKDGPSAGVAWRRRSSR